MIKHFLLRTSGLHLRSRVSKEVKKQKSMSIRRTLFLKPQIFLRQISEKLPVGWESRQTSQSGLKTNDPPKAWKKRWRESLHLSWKLLEEKTQRLAMLLIYIRASPRRMLSVFLQKK